MTPALSRATDHQQEATKDLPTRLGYRMSGAATSDGSPIDIRRRNLSRVPASVGATKDFTQQTEPRGDSPRSSPVKWCMTRDPSIGVRR